ncbi:tRNA1(Val) (adenine(37)-N6)-methyltransferase [Tumebacillus permanentifrigoris]|uniref:tRNA1(Val) A37 N6-methylase TrmN6 n=1 Tax=Tumebacillus permanentifrigoris TaxID=378543 RepID=A0A316D689_9BACL|nr:tRNA1(Val) (adenine(37)-N6)-methyltransferase [Tumebacillus permanentifrigoris]PWK07944.1 tRNA1(Val) A37 N6-methylase TrmN6 [Tumebacillus permanentifrigoris]
MTFDLKPGERLDDLQTKNLRIIQSDEVFSFSLDAVLLAHYVSLRNRDRVLDMGTGNGVIPLLLASRSDLPRREEIVGLELQERLADMAQRNVSGNELEHTIKIVQGDLREAIQHFGHESFDVVTCNPPYRPAGIGDASVNPHIAIARFELTCTLEDVIVNAAKLLKFNGKFAMVHRPDRLPDIIALMRTHRLEPKRLLLVHPRAHLRPNILLIEGIKGGKPELRIDPPLLVHTDDGVYTQAIQDIYAGRGEFAR